MPTNKSSYKNKKSSKNKTKVGSLMNNGLKFSRFQFVALAFVFAVVGGYVLFRSFAATSNQVNVNQPVVGVTLASGDDGYILAGRDGGVFLEGSAKGANTTVGSKTSFSLPGLGINVNNIVGIAETLNEKGQPTNAGYYLLGSDGAVYAFGNAQIRTSANGGALDGTGVNSGHNSPFVGIATSSTGGYWLVDADGQVYAFDAPASGNAPSAVGIAATPSGKGYWVETSGAGTAATSNGPNAPTYPFGDAQYAGNPPSDKVVGITAGAPGTGYVAASSDGGAFAMGGASFYGSMGGQHLNGAIVGIAHTADYGGYWLVGSDGGVFAFGDAQFQGTVVYTAPPQPAPGAVAALHAAATATSSPSSPTPSSPTSSSSSTGGSGQGHGGGGSTVPTSLSSCSSSNASSYTKCVDSYCGANAANYSECNTDQSEAAAQAQLNTELGEPAYTGDAQTNDASAGTQYPDPTTPAGVNNAPSGSSTAGQCDVIGWTADCITY